MGRWPRDRSPNLLLAGYVPETVNNYRIATRTFLRWCTKHRTSNSKPPKTSSELDQLLCLYFQQHFVKNGGSGRQHCANVVNGIAMMLPQLRGSFPLANRCLTNWKKLVPSKAYPPLTLDLACVIAMAFLKRGMQRYAVAVLLSFDCLLRVSECMSLRASDIVLTGDRRFGSSIDSKSAKFDFSSCALRIRHAKGGDDQFVAVLDHRVAELLSLLVRGLGDEQFVFPSSTAHRASGYRYQFLRIISELGLDARFTPHSARHGGATYLKLHKNWPMADIQERGRWKSMSSAFHYVQMGRSLLVTSKVPRHLRDAGAVFSKHLLECFALAQKN